MCSSCRWCGPARNGMPPDQKKKAYRCDVTYVTNSYSTAENRRKLWLLRSHMIIRKSSINSWLVVWLPFFIFPYIGNQHPNWLIFFRGVETTNQGFYGIFMDILVDSSSAVAPRGVPKQALQSPSVSSRNMVNSGKDGAQGSKRYQEILGLDCFYVHWILLSCLLRTEAPLAS